MAWYRNSILGRVAPAVLFLCVGAGTAFGQQLLWDVTVPVSDDVEVPSHLELTKDGVTVVSQAHVSGIDLVVRTLSRATGRVKSTARAPGLLSCLRPCSRQPIIHLSPLFFTTALNQSSDGQFVGFSVVALDEQSAAIQWSAYWHLDDAPPAAMAASPQAVIVVSEAGGVRAYDPTSGYVLWESHLDATASGFRLALAGNRLFVALKTADSELRVRAYNARSGRLRWEESRSIPVNLGTLLVSGADLYLSGSLPRPANNPVLGDTIDVPYLARLEAATGRTVWENSDIQLGGGAFLYSPVVDGDRIVAVAQLRIPLGPSPYGYSLVSYRVSDGQVNWFTVESSAPIVRIAVRGDRVYAVGTSFGVTSGVIVLRAYDAATGEFRWQDFSHGAEVIRTPGIDPVLAVPFGADLALDEHRLFILGFEPSHSVIRAYDISGEP